MSPETASVESPRHCWGASVIVMELLGGFGGEVVEVLVRAFSVETHHPFGGSDLAAREDKKTGKFVKTLGSRKLWIWLRGQGHDVARCTVERIMGENGWEGAR